MRKIEEILQKRAKAKRFKSDTSKFIKSLKNLIQKHAELTTIVQSLMQVYFAKKYRQSVFTISRFNYTLNTYLYLIQYYITILCSIFYSNNLMTYFGLTGRPLIYLDVHD